MHTHSKLGKLIWLVIIILIAGGVYYFYKIKTADPFDKINIVEDVIPTTKTGLSLYENYLYSFRFEYPANLYMKEREVGSNEKSQLAIVLVEGKKENIDVIEGKSTDVREGPTAITLDVYQNDKKLSPVLWAEQDTNWKIGDKKTSTASVNGEPGVSYKWSGLYEGESVIITKGTEAYVFSVTWMTPEDQILKDFDMILNSFTFTE